MTVPGFIWRSIMTSPMPTLEGVFAIHKPPAISSAQVLRDLQTHLNPSKTFAPWINAQRSQRDLELSTQKQKKSRRQRQPIQVKMGHGGTLDPMATGVLIVGVGNGTKSLQGFLDGTKTYDTTVVFGAATDTYDSEGKIVKRAEYAHVTRDKVEEALSRFRGDILQKPPIFSALRVQGKRLYEYAREGKEVPVEIQERPVTVSQLELLEWYEPGTHKYNFPEREAEQEEKEVVDKLLQLEEPAKKSEEDVEQEESAQADETQDLKRKRDEDGETVVDTEAKKLKQDEGGIQPTAAASSTEAPPTQDTSSAAPTEARKPCPAPAARIRMTVSSGFYVRSLCHDLGTAVNSLGFMTSLSRTRQSEFELGKNVLDYDDLALGEDVWGPKVVGMLEQWNVNHPDGYARQSQPAKRQHGSASGEHKTQKRPANQKPAERTRNSSSPEA